MASIVTQSGDPTEPLVGRIFSILVMIVTTAIITSLITRKAQRVQHWASLPGIAWLVFAIYFDSWLFILISGILKFGVGLNTSFGVCEGALFLCLISYLSTKILIYMFLVEKAYIIRQGTAPKPRLKSKLYLFNSVGMLGCFVVIGVFNIIFRITRQENGECIIGMERFVMIPLISFDILVNMYLTILFLLPLRTLYNFRHAQHSAANERLRVVAYRTFIGAVSTTISSVINLTALMALDGEPAWVCFMCCQIDIGFSAIVVHWVTSKDKNFPTQQDVLNDVAKGGSNHHQNRSANGTVAAGVPSSRAGHHLGHISGKRSSSNRVVLIKSRCIHECRPGSGCYKSGADNNNVVLNGAGRQIGSPSTSSATMISEHPAESIRSDTPSKFSEFSKYGAGLFADDIDPLELDHWAGENQCSDKEDEHELVSRTMTYRTLNISQKTTVVVESTAIKDLEKGIVGSDGPRVMLGFMTVCSAGAADEDESDKDETQANRGQGGRRDREIVANDTIAQATRAGGESEPVSRIGTQDSTI